MFKRLANQFNTTIIGQEDVKEKLLVALYPLLNKNKKTIKNLLKKFINNS